MNAKRIREAVETVFENSGLISVTVHLEDGTSYETDINGQSSDEEIRDYFVGKPLQFGDTEAHPKDKLITVKSVDIHR